MSLNTCVQSYVGKSPHTWDDWHGWAAVYTRHKHTGGRKLWIWDNDFKRTKARKDGKAGKLEREYAIGMQINLAKFFKAKHVYIGGRGTCGRCLRDSFKWIQRVMAASHAAPDVDPEVILMKSAKWSCIDVRRGKRKSKR